MKAEKHYCGYCFRIVRDSRKKYCGKKCQSWVSVLRTWKGIEDRRGEKLSLSWKMKRFRAWRGLELYKLREVRRRRLGIEKGFVC